MNSYVDFLNFFLNQVISKGREIGPAGVEISLHVTSG